MDHFNGLLNDMKERQLEHALTGCCVIRIVFVLRENEGLFEAITSKMAVRRITSDYTTCLLTSYLYEMLPFHAYIGWGMGYDIVTAHQNALRAIRESTGDPHRYTYLMNEQNEMIGPLCGDRTISYQLRPSARTNHIAKILGISMSNLEKMISLQKNRDMVHFSASDLVFYLDITPRSATRILKKLVEHGAAQKVNSMNLNGPGETGSDL